MTGIIEDEVTVGTPIGEIIPSEEKSAELFVPNGLDKIIAIIRREVEQFQPDISTEKGRKAIASLARKVASSKSRLEEYGKNLSAKIKVQAVGIDAERKRMRETLDELRDQARKPLDDYESAVKIRVESHEQALKDVIELGNVPFGATVAEIEGRLSKLDEFGIRPWEEFAERASLAYDATLSRLSSILAETKQQEAMQVAFQKSEADRIAREAKEAKEQQEKDQAERDMRIAREATEKAESAAKDREAASLREKEAAEARAAKAEQDAKDAAERAVAAEQKRATDAKAAEAAAQAQREANKQHCAKINREVRDAFVSHGAAVEHATELVRLIALGEIPHTKIIY
jgi:hypothetical protein